MNELLVMAVSVIVSGLVAYAVAQAQTRREASSQLDSELREARLNAYPWLWKMTELLPLWPPDEVRYEQLVDLSYRMRNWYFNQGGIYLSRPAQFAYLRAQQAIGAALVGQKIWGSETLNGKTVGVYRDPATVPQATLKAVISVQDYQAIRQGLSDLRYHLTQDLLGRRAPAAEIADPSSTS